MAKLAMIIEGAIVREYELDDMPAIIGRNPDNAVQISDTTVSGRHAILTPKESEYVEDDMEYELEDLGSTNGTLVNGKKVGKHLMSNGDQIQIGRHVFQFSDGAEGDFSRTDIILPENP